MANKKHQIPLDRIEKVLKYIDANLDQPLTVEALADESSWSRWQFQRVFSHATGLSVAQYVRELRLSRAAEMLITSTKRHLDIALCCGFESEISFSRAFKQMFECTPGEYRRRNLYVGVRTPLKVTDYKKYSGVLDPRLMNIRLENRPSFSIAGVCGEINGILSDKPNFAQKVPELWDQFGEKLKNNSMSEISPVGVIDTRKAGTKEQGLPYWASTVISTSAPTSTLQQLCIPTQEYAVIPHRGPIVNLHKTLEWVVHCWLPDSGYQGANGFELEVYELGYDPTSEEAYMEYWLSIQRYNPISKNAISAAS